MVLTASEEESVDIGHHRRSQKCVECGERTYGKFSKVASAWYVTSKAQVRLVRAELKIDFFSFIIRRYFFAIHVELKAKIVSPSHAGVNPVTW